MNLYPYMPTRNLNVLDMISRCLRYPVPMVLLANATAGMGTTQYTDDILEFY